MYKVYIMGDGLYRVVTTLDRNMEILSIHNTEREAREEAERLNEKDLRNV